MIPSEIKDWLVDALCTAMTTERNDAEVYKHKAEIHLYNLKKYEEAMQWLEAQPVGSATPKHIGVIVEQSIDRVLIRMPVESEHD